MLTGLIASLALRTGLPQRAIVAIGILLLVGAAILAWNLWLADHDGEVIAGHEQAVEVKVEREGRAADQKLEERKGAALAEQSKQRQEFDNATAHLPKRRLTDRQRIDACDQLRRQGTDPAILARAKCVQTGGAAEAGPPRGDQR